MNGPHHGREALPHAAPFEAFGIVLLCFGWFILASAEAVAAWRAGHTPATAFTDARFMALLAVEIVMGALSLALLRSRRYPLHTLQPQPSWRDALVGVGLYLCATFVVSIVVPLVPHPAAAPLDQIMAEGHVSRPTAVLVSIVNGAYEEVFLLGYLMRGLRRYGASTALGVVLLVRLLCHMYQGPVGALSVMLFGAVLGIYYQRKGRLFPVVTAHIIADLVALLWLGTRS